MGLQNENPQQVQLVDKRYIVRKYAEGAIMERPQMGLALGIGFGLGQVLGAVMTITDNIPVVGDVIFAVGEGCKFSRMQAEKRAIMTQIQQEELKLAQMKAQTQARNTQRRQHTEDVNFDTGEVANAF